MSYHQITREERYTISALRKQGYKTSRIATVLGRHRSSIYREIRRNQCSDSVTFHTDLPSQPSFAS